MRRKVSLDRAARLRQLADARFWDPAAGCYADAFVDGALTPNGSRHANAFAVPVRHRQARARRPRLANCARESRRARRRDAVHALL